MAKQKWRRLGTALRVFREDGWRDLVILLNKRLGVRYLDFSKASLTELGLSADHANPHQGSSNELDFVMKKLDIASDDLIIDIGCGKGAAMVVFAKYSFRRIDGLDLSSELVHLAKQNLSRLLLRKRTRVFCSDATTFTNLDEYTHIYLYNPFPDSIMRSVMENVRASFARRPRDLTIIYSNPICHKDILANGVFEKVAEYSIGNKAPTFIYRPCFQNGTPHKAKP